MPRRPEIFPHTIVDLFYEYLTGRLPLPEGHIIGNDCVHKHGKEGKTVRKVLKSTRTQSNCIRCLQNNAVRKRSFNRRNDYPTRDLAALSKAEIIALEQDPFDI